MRGFIGSILLFSTLLASAQPTVATLTLEDCVARALKRNFSIEAGRYDLANASEAHTLAKSNFDPSLQLSTQRTATRSDSTGSLTHIDETRASLSQKTPLGSRIELSSRLNRDDLSPDISLLGPAYDADLTLSISQPLLRGFGPAANLASQRRSRIGLDRASHVFRATVMDVVRDTELAFNRLIFARKQLAVRRLSLEAAEKLFGEIRQRKETGISTNLDALTAEVGAANARRNVILAEQQVSDREDGLRALIGQFELEAPLGDATFATTAIEALDIAAITQRALQAQPDYLAARAQVSQRAVDVKAAQNARLPSLDLGAAAGYNTRDRLSSTNAIHDLEAGDGYLWQLGLTLTYPIGQRGDAAQLRSAKNALQRDTTLLRQLEQTIAVNSRAAVRSIETNRAAVAAAALTEQLGEEQYKLEKARYDAGLSTSRRVLDAQRDLDEARTAHLQSQIALQESLITLRRLEGRILDAYNSLLPSVE